MIGNPSINCIKYSIVSARNLIFKIDTIDFKSIEIHWDFEIVITPYRLLLKGFKPHWKINQSNQVLRKPVKLLNSQNVNYWNRYWSRFEFIRLRIQYGTKISQEIKYHSIQLHYFGRFARLCCETSFFIETFIHKGGKKNERKR